MSGLPAPSRIRPAAGVATDEGPRRDTTAEKLSQLKPLREGWAITAATASQISDGAAALLIASPAAVRQHGFTPRARIHTLAVTGSDPVYMLTGPMPATERALEKGHLTVDDIDVFEVNEAFAPVLLAWSADTGASLEKTNPNGSAIAPRAPAGRDRRDPDDQAAARAGARRGPVRPADHVRGRRPGQRHHHRAAQLGSPEHRRPPGRAVRQCSSFQGNI